MGEVTKSTRDFLENLGLTKNSDLNLSGSPITAALSILQCLIPEALDFPGSASYNESVMEHWSQTVVQQASGIVHPKSAYEVSTCIKIFEHFQTPFAVRSGGHQTAKGASAIENGVLLSLDRLDSVLYNPDNEVATFGPGNRWFAVYKHLEQYDRAVTGGHIGVVGCGGQITGGGTSPFLHRQGFSFANVKNFEVVVGGGRIVNANAEENEDLFWALKGGASNFGVVTRLDMRTFPLTGVWGGSIMHDISKKQDVLDAFWEFQQEGIVKDPGVEMLLGFSIVGDQSRIQSEVCADRRGHAEGSCPIAFKPFFDIGLLYSDACDRTFPDLAVSATANPPPEFALWFSPHGRMNFAMVSLKPDRTFYSDAVDIFYSAFEPARRVPDAQVNVHLSALQGRTVRHANELGGMAAGWDEEDQLFFNIEMVWSAAEDDELMLKLTRQCIDRVKEAAIERGVFLPFIWMNNSQTEDDVLTSYGASNYSKMKQVSREYDPGQTFQKLCSGPFKLNESI